MKLVVDANQVPFQAISRQKEFPGVGEIPDSIRDVEEIQYKFLGQDPKKGPWVYVVKFKAGHHIQKHSHGADRVEYVLDGAIQFDGKVLGKDGFTFITAGIEYEYDIVEDTTILVVFNGPPGLMVM